MSEEAFVVDFSESVERKLLPKGWYRVRIERIQPKTASTGTPMETVMARVIGGEYDQQVVFQNWPKTGRGAGITKSAIRAILGDAAADGQTRFSREDFIGIEAMVYVTQHVYAVEDGGDGKLRSNVSSWAAIEVAEDDEGNIKGLF